MYKPDFEDIRARIILRNKLLSISLVNENEYDYPSYRLYSFYLKRGHFRGLNYKINTWAAVCRFYKEFKIVDPLIRREHVEAFLDLHQKLYGKAYQFNQL